MAQAVIRILERNKPSPTAKISPAPGTRHRNAKNAIGQGGFLVFQQREIQDGVRLTEITGMSHNSIIGVPIISQKRASMNPIWYSTGYITIVNIQNYLQQFQLRSKQTFASDVF
jgi:hypothetical protein